ncbi:MAG TPA: retention module-containing protein, partial [Rhodocyclaceae bacterium]|nr:retention module-containing protein [Rhodocyclaceae bacterium]
MATGNPIGKVVLLQGQVTARDEHGQVRVLKLGDIVFEGEVLVTKDGSRVEIGFDNGSHFLLREHETVTLDSAVFNVEADDPSTASLLGRIQENTTDIARAIAEGKSLDDLLEETAAGLDGGGGDASHMFVELVRIGETVTPLNYDFNSPSSGPQTVLPTGVSVSGIPAPASGGTGTGGGGGTLLPGNTDATVTLTASATVVAEGDHITYTATVDLPVVGTPLVITLSNGATITIPVGDTRADSGPISVRPDDPNIQGSQIVNVSISGTTGGTYTSLDTTSHTSTTVVDDATATIVTLSAPSVVAEGGSISYSASLSHPAETPVTITLSNGSTITIAAGQSTGSVTVPVHGDDPYIDAGNLSVTISSATGGNFENLLADHTAAVTLVTDTTDLSTVTLSAAANVSEGGSVVYTATVSNAVTGSPLVIHLNNGTDITIPVGSTTGTSAAVPVRADDAYSEGNQNVTVGITSTSGGNYEALNTASTVTTVVGDDSDATSVTLSAAANVAEGSSITYTATVGAPVTGSPLVIHLDNGQDITIAVGSTTGTSAAVPVR